MLKFFRFIPFLCYCSVSVSQSIDWAKVHDLTIKGIDQLYNLEMDQAEQTFDQAIRMAPNDPRGYFFKGMIYFWTFTLNRNENAYNRFFELSDKVIAICEEELERDEKNVVATFYLGGIYGYRGLAYQRNGSLLKAAWDGRKGYSYLKEAVTMKPDLYDAQMGFGLFSYLVGKVPKSYRWLLTILGFSGDVEGGLASLRLAAEHGLYTRSEAMFLLSQFLNVEDRQEEARAYLKHLIEKYPDNALFLVTLAQWELRDNRVDEAIEAAQRAVAINNRKKIQFGDEFAYSVLANCYFTKNDFPSAQKNYEFYLQAAENEENIPNSVYYRLGLCYEIASQRGKALDAYKQLRKVELGRGNPWDPFYYRRGQIRMQRPLTETDLLLIKAENEASLDQHEKAMKLYRDALTRGLDTDQLAIALYGIVQAYYEQQRYQEAIETAQWLVTLQPPHEQWLLPHGHFKLGQAYAKLGLVTEAHREFERVDNYRDYDFQSRLESRTEQELRKLSAID